MTIADLPAINKDNIRNLPRPSYIKWLLREKEHVLGIQTDCYFLDWEIDEAELEAWALHVRRHYIRDDELLEDCSLHEMNVKDYLSDFCIPMRYERDKRGPAVRAGDFAEIIISDLLQFIEGFSVPRYKQIDRINPNASDQGSDVIAYKIEDPDNPKRDDLLLIIEVKAKLTDPVELDKVIKNAAMHSRKDAPDGDFRAPFSLRAFERRSRRVGDDCTASECRRLLNLTEHPLTIRRGSAAVVSLGDVTALESCPPESLGLSEDERLIVIHGNKLMELVHSVYDRCVK
ncbi:hypothetical protein [uncultured Slackia sp.]|uniref:hypothetical protein n=1 Tax=uncultured Slackia sp. TaxID=665903 RepID=UPI0025DB2480|nr:hypothetical protein [uncultured Slackia sp.]